MRVLLAVHAFPPASTAGVEVYTLRLARALRALGHEVLVLAAVHDLAARPYALRRRTHQGVDVAEVVNVHHRRTLEATYSDPDLDRAVAPVLEAFRPDCVHLQHLLNLSTGIVWEAKRLGAPVVLTLHDYWLSCPRDGLRMREDLVLCQTMDHAVCARCLTRSPYLPPPLQTGLMRLARNTGAGAYLHAAHARAAGATEALLSLLRRVSPVRADGLAEGMDRRVEQLRETLTGVDLVLAPTRFMRDRALEFGVAEERLRVCGHGAVFGPIRARREGPRRRIGFVGTLAPHKGVHVLLEAFRGLACPEATLDIHGSPAAYPSYSARLRQTASGDPRIRLRGPFPEGEQGRILESLDLLVAPSLWWENSPLAIIEALAAGVPVVASAAGGVPEIVEEGVGGLLVPPGDSAALRSALDDVVEGRRLAGTAPPIRLKTVDQGATELVGIYGEVKRARPMVAPLAKAP